MTSEQLIEMDAEDAETLRKMLEGTSEEGDALLSRLLPSLDPAWTRDQIHALGKKHGAPIGQNGASVSAGTEAVWPLPTRTVVDAAALAAFSQKFADALGGSPLSVDEVKSTRFQTKEDWQRYGFAPGAIKFHAGGMRVSPPMWRQLAHPERALSHEVRPGQDPSVAPLRLGLFADFGTGTYPAKAIARQLAAASLPYAFHLGDVYYAGTTNEFEHYFRAPLGPLIDHTEFFMLSGNHEMYAKGVNFQAYIREKAALYPGLQRQNGEMFRLVGNGFQIIGLDTMWTDWEGGHARITSRVGAAEHALLQSWLSEAGGDRLTILLTSDHPWDIGQRSTTKLLSDINTFVREGRIDLWFWGNVHYAALYAPWQFEGVNAPGFIGSCIGHGGYPFYTMERGALPDRVDLRWLETKHRFWPYSNIRPDVGMNGWCEMALSRGRDGWSVTLSYRDWVGRDRAIADIVKRPGGRAEILRLRESNYDPHGQFVLEDR